MAKNYMNWNEIKRGDILFMRLGEHEGKGSEQNGNRLFIVVQNNTGNRFSPNIIAVALTGSPTKSNIPTHQELLKNRDIEFDPNFDHNTLNIYDSSLILCEQIRTLSKERIIMKVGRVNKPAMERINRSLAISVGLL